MRGFSKAIIAGNVTRDPELRTTANGRQVCSFSIAVNRVYRDANGENQSQTSYIDCVAWSRTGETISQYIHKGDPFLVSGRLEQRSWEDKQTGQKRYSTELVVEDFTFISGRGDDNGNGNYSGGNYRSHNGFTNSAPATPPANAPAPGGDVAPDDIPEGEVDLSEIPF